jgi:hypothetical protein
LIFWWCGRPWLPACQVWRWLKTRSHEISGDLGMVRRWRLYHEIGFLIGF